MCVPQRLKSIFLKLFSSLAPIASSPSFGPAVFDFFLNLDIRIYNLAFETNNGYPKQQYRLPKLYYSTDFSIIMSNNFFSAKKCSINKKCWPFRHEMDFFNVSLLLWFSISFWCLVRTLLLKTLKWLKMRLTLLINYCLLCA